MVLGDTSNGNIGVVVLGGSSDDIGAAVIGEVIVRSKFWKLDKSQDSSGICEFGWFPSLKGASSLITGRRDK